MKSTSIRLPKLMILAVLLSGGGLCTILLVNQPQSALGRSRTPTVSWTTILSWFKRHPVKHGSRGFVCPIAPITVVKNVARRAEVTSVPVWQLRPLFVWTGAAEKLEVRRKQDYELLWSTELTSQQTHRVYQGDTELQPGETYVWQLWSRIQTHAPSVLSSTFRVMTEAERQQVQQDLAAVETQVPDQTPERLALHRAHYFTQNSLWSDGLWEALRVQKPSWTLMAFRQELKQQTCEDS